MGLQWLIFILYSGIAIYIGKYASQNADDDFWTANRSLSGFSVGLSISAGFMSVSWSCVYSTQLFYWYGLGAIWLVTIPWVIALIVIYYISSHYHALPAFSQPEMAMLRYGKSGKLMVAIALIFVFLVWGGAEIYIASVLLSPGLGISKNFMIILISIVVGIYSMFGGFKAVVATDKLQYVMVALYVIIITFLAGKGVHQVGQPFLFSELNPAKSQHSWALLFSPGILIIILSAIAYLPGWIFETDIWLRIQAAKSKKAARQGIIISVANSILFVGVFPLLIAAFALFLYAPQGGIIPAELGFEGDAIFLKIVQDFSPFWLLPLISLGLIAASMSTIDTNINIVSLSIAHDLLPDYLKKVPSLKINRITTCFTVIFFAIYAMLTESLWDIFYLSSGILSTTVALIILGVIWKSLPAKPVVWSAWTGFISTILAYFLEKFQILQTLEPNWLAESQLGYIFWGMLMALFAFSMGIFLEQNSE